MKDNNRKNMHSKQEAVQIVRSGDSFIYDITPPDVATFIDKVIEIISKAYAQIGGYKGVSDQKRFLKGIALLRVITNESFSPDQLSEHQDSIMAIEVFRNAEGSFKSIALAKNVEKQGSGALARELIKYDIDNYKGLYWAEVSGAVEHLMKKYHGFPIPNIYAEEILKKKDLEFDDDGIHYYRTIGMDDPTKFCKVIYGFKSHALYDKVVNSIIDILGVAMTYSEFKDYVNDLPDKKEEDYTSIGITNVLTKIFTENNSQKDESDLADIAQGYIECVATASYEDDISEFPNDVIKCLKLCINSLRRFGSRYSDSVAQGEDLLTFITPLEIHEF